MPLLDSCIPSPLPRISFHLTKIELTFHLETPGPTNEGATASTASKCKEIYKQFQMNQIEALPEPCIHLEDHLRTSKSDGPFINFSDGEVKDKRVLTPPPLALSQSVPPAVYPLCYTPRPQYQAYLNPPRVPDLMEVESWDNPQRVDPTKQRVLSTYEVLQKFDDSRRQSRIAGALATHVPTNWCAQHFALHE